MPHRMGSAGYQKILGIYIDVSQGGGMGNARLCVVTEVAGRVTFQPLTLPDSSVATVSAMTCISPERLEELVAMVNQERKIA